MEDWILCKDQLPEQDGDYLITNRWGEVHEASYVEGWNCYRRLNGTVDHRTECEAGSVIAWLPLPQPYKE